MSKLREILFAVFIYLPFIALALWLMYLYDELDNWFIYVNVGICGLGFLLPIVAPTEKKKEVKEDE